MKHLFGWSYPPGAASDPFAPWNQDESPCEVCGGGIDHCVCPECPVCGSVGDIDCYDGNEGLMTHKLTRTQAQLDSMAAADAREADERAAIERAYAEAADDEIDYCATCGGLGCASCGDLGYVKKERRDG